LGKFGLALFDLAFFVCYFVHRIVWMLPNWCTL